MKISGYNLQFGKLCNMLGLGELIGQPSAVSGGFSHKMYAVITTQGKYAIKALNPQRMLRTDGKQHFVVSEHIADIASKRVPAITAKKFDDKVIQELDNQFYLIFDWVDGISLEQTKSQWNIAKKSELFLQVYI